jgi:hypothetical protein
MGVMPTGSVSLTVTSPLVLPYGLTFEAVMVQLAFDPRVKLPT